MPAPRLRLAPAVLLVLTLTGCSQSRTAPVEGRVVWSDGTPALDLVGYQVESEVPGSRVGARGNIDADGRFKLGTYGMDDGAEPGAHKAVVSPIPRTEVDPPPKVKLSARYADPATSGLEFTVERGKRNEVTLTVSRK